jgi:threonine synthase
LTSVQLPRHGGANGEHETDDLAGNLASTEKGHHPHRVMALFVLGLDSRENVVQLRCSNPDCATPVDRLDRRMKCPSCGDLLEVRIDPPRAPTSELAREWRHRRLSDDALDRSGVWRFRELLPRLDRAGPVVTLQEGNTPLLPGSSSAAYAGLRALRFKHLGWNPTGSFKDTGMTVAVTHAKSEGFSCVACASTGNTAASMAAFAAHAGLRAMVYLPKGNVAIAKLAQTLDYGAEIIEVEGNFDAALDRLLDSAPDDHYFVNSLNPFRLEGQKTVMIELMEQLEWRPPDYIVLPGGNLGNASAFGKGLEELHASGLIAKLPRLVVVQAEGASPFFRTWRSGSSTLQAVSNPQTAASAIRIGAPRSWKKGLRALRVTGGCCVEVSEPEIAAAKATIGRDGIGCEPASATTLAALRRLVDGDEIDPEADIVAILTGHVLKDPDYIVAQRSARLTTPAAAPGR